MSLEQLERSITEKLTEQKQINDQLRAEISKKGEVNQQLTADLGAVSQELEGVLARMTDIEQKGVVSGELDGRETWVQKAADALIATMKTGARSASYAMGSLSKAVGSGAASAGVLIEPQRMPGVMMPGLRRLTIRQLMAQGRISSNSLEYARENVFTNAAAPVAEGALKPESNITFTKEAVMTVTLAHWVRASRQVLADAPLLQSYINGRLLYGLAFAEEAQLLNGNGTGDNLSGLNTVATAYDTSLTVAAATGVEGDTNADILAHAIYQVALSEFDATGIILNPLDWHKLALLKDKNNNYILGGPQAFASNTLWGLPVVATQAQAAKTFTVGAFSLSSQVFDREDATIDVAMEDGDNFTRNMVTIRCEERLGVAHFRPQAIVKGAFA